jgi:hypothetical protein
VNDFVETVSFTGGSRIGWVNASWPFARLTCDGVRLNLSSLGKHEFTAEHLIQLRHGFALAPLSTQAIPNASAIGPAIDYA